MSGLEKFENTENWRSNLKKFLLIERKPALKKVVAASDVKHYNLDVSKDLENLLKDRKEEIEREKQSALQQQAETADLSDNMDDRISQNDKRFGKNEDNNVYSSMPSSSSKLTYYMQEYGETNIPIDSPLRKISDESFEAMERMCEKTASDPDSTLFQYLHSDDQEQILDDVKRRSTLDKDFSGNESDKRADTLLGKFSDCTLLDDIEAPSRLFENTIAGETTAIRTSPVKMVGLMRPSTIMEEAGDESRNSDNSSQNSFLTASTKGHLLDDISSCYDTAHDSTLKSSNLPYSTNQSQKSDLIEIDVDDMLMSAIEKSNAQMSNMQQQQRLYELENDLIDLGSRSNSPKCMKLKEDTTNVVVIDDDDDHIETNEQQQTCDNDEDESVISLLSDEDEDQESFEKCSDIQTDSYSNDSSLRSKEYDENKENCEFEMSSERSMKFNDTMEEVEYLLKKGMEYMAEHPETKKHIMPETNAAQARSISPLESEEQTSSVSKDNISSSTYVKKLDNIAVTPSSNRHALDVKPFPKLDLFGRSNRVGISHPRHKELANKAQFAHIVSPVGAYMKNTAFTPLMSTGKMENRQSNILNATAFRELEYESIAIQTKSRTNSSDLFAQDSSGLSKLPGISGVQKVLPKKAYISSEFKQIVDERTPMKIPCGNKMKKYLDSTTMVAVLRHDGKMKMPSGVNSLSTNMPAPSKLPLKVNYASSARDTTAASPRNNASLADLSLMTGDVSMYTIMDAQKF